MYKIIGADRRPYGPITAEQLKQWIAEGRANAQTPAQIEGATEWKPLSAFPEFAESLGSNVASGPPPLPPPPLNAPAGATVDPEALAARILERGYDLEIGDCFGRSWELVKQHFWLVVGTTFLAGLIQSAIPILATVVQGGLFLFYLKLIRGQKAAVGDAFAGFSLAFLQLFLLGLVMWILLAFGFALCLLPGIYLAVAWVLAAVLVIDQRLDFWPAMELSRKVVTAQWWTMFGLLIVGALIIFAGMLACLVGVFVATPIFLGAIAFAYEDIFGEQTTQAH